METVKNSPSGEFLVYVDDWSFHRLVQYRDGRVSLEIARMDCSHCGTCSDRMESTTARVRAAGLQVDWQRVGGGYMISIPLPDEVDPVDHLSAILGLPVSKVRKPLKIKVPDSFVAVSQKKGGPPVALKDSVSGEHFFSTSEEAYAVLHKRMEEDPSGAAQLSMNGGEYSVLMIHVFDQKCDAYDRRTHPNPDSIFLEQ